MVETLLKSILSDAKITILSENIEFGFTIKRLESKIFKNQLIFTEGLSKNTQDVKEGFEAFKKIELYFLLPDYWNLEENFWPVNWLNKLAELPKKNNTWFGAGDTIPAGTPPQLLSDRFDANHFMLTEPIALAEFFSTEKWIETEIQFLGIVPISQIELAYKLRNSATVLIQRLIKNNYTERVDMFRTPVCKKRIFDLF